LKRENEGGAEVNSGAIHHFNRRREPPNRDEADNLCNGTGSAGGRTPKQSSSLKKTITKREGVVRRKNGQKRKGPTRGRKREKRSGALQEQLPTGKGKKKDETQLADRVSKKQKVFGDVYMVLRRRAESEFGYLKRMN